MYVCVRIHIYIYIYVHTFVYMYIHTHPACDDVDGRVDIREPVGTYVLSIVWGYLHGCDDMHFGVVEARVGQLESRLEEVWRFGVCGLWV